MTFIERYRGHALSPTPGTVHIDDADGTMHVYEALAESEAGRVADEFLLAHAREHDADEWERTEIRGSLEDGFSCRMEVVERCECSAILEEYCHGVIGGDVPSAEEPVELRWVAPCDRGTALAVSGTPESALDSPMAQILSVHPNCAEYLMSFRDEEGMEADPWLEYAG